MISHDIFNENTEKCQKGGQDTAKVSQRAPKVSQKGAKVSQKGAKGSQKGAKGSQKAAKGSQKGAKGRPKCIKKSTFGKGRENDGKREVTANIFWSHFGDIFHQKSMKKSMRKPMPKK